MQLYPGLEPQYRARLEQFHCRLGKRLFQPQEPLEIRFARSADPVPFTDRLAGVWAPIREGDIWGGAWENAWFQFTGRVPAEWAGRRVVARIDLAGEALVVGPDGAAVQGLSNGSLFDVMPLQSARTEVLLLERAAGGESVEIWAEAVAHGLQGIHQEPDPDPGSPDRHGRYEGRVNLARLCVMDETAWHLWLDMEVLLGLLRSPHVPAVRRARILRGLTQAVDRFDERMERAAECRERLQCLLDQPAHASAMTAISVGHAHIDVGWLWPIREGARKAERTFATQLDLIERYPGYVFGASQPALYRFIKERRPELYERIRSAVRSGQWECQGAMWVEADCNLPCGESLARQLLHGKNFYRDEFGIEVRNLWIPDVFGYAASLPQLLKRAGVDFFLTQKMSWNKVNVFPHTTFRWRGIDGSEVITHFPPENTYNSRMQPEDLAEAEDRFREKDRLEEMMCLFGFGDGGGGPKPEAIERALRMRNLEGVPRVRLGRADDFFDRLSAAKDDLPVWAGELYLETHRGTATTQGRTKRGNRAMELALRETEYLWACLPADVYPAGDLDRLWKDLLTHQFHDILPGPSIRPVYEEAERTLGAGLDACASLVRQAAGRLGEADPDALTIINTLNVPVTRVLALPAGWEGAEDVTGGETPAQKEQDGAVCVRLEIPAQGQVALRRTLRVPPSVEPGGVVLENREIRYTFNDGGELIGAYDKTAQREILVPDRPGNRLTLYDDRPVEYDAWDVDLYYEHAGSERLRAERRVSLGRGPVRQGLRFEYRFGASTLTQRIALDASGKRLDFVTEVDWQERHRMLRVAFEVAVDSPEATFEIPYGYVRRPTHRNTSWDVARFETVAQRWADLSDPGYGVALLNDGKYGHKIFEGVLDLNLLRSPTYPDPDADRGRHLFTYSLLPHEGGAVESDVIREAAQLNQPPVCLEGVRIGSLPVVPTVSGDGVDFAVFKKAETSRDRILRLVETRGCATTAVINLRSGCRLVETDLMEWNDLADRGEGAIPIPMRAFEIRTFRMTVPGEDGVSAR